MRRNDWTRSGIFNLLFQVIYLAVFYLIGYRNGIAGDPGLRLMILAGMVLISALAWAGFFYLLDYKKPEPVNYVSAAYMAGMAICSLVYLPLTYAVLRLPEWQYSTTGLFVSGAIFLKGGGFAILLFLLLRIGFIPRKPFDEPVDGMVYGGIAAAGFATVQVVYTLSGQSQVTLFVIAYSTATQVLVYSGIGSLVGYLAGWVKFRNEDNGWFAALGVILGSLLLGGFFLGTEFIFLQGIASAFWVSFLFSAVYSILLLAAVVAFMSKVISRRTRRPRRRRIPVQVPVAAGILLIMAAALVTTYRGISGESVQDARTGVSLRIPSSLSRITFSGPSAGLNRAASGEILLQRRTWRAPHFTFSLTARDRQEAPLFRMFEAYLSSRSAHLLISDITVDGFAGKRLVYDEMAETESAKSGIPMVRRSIVDIVPVREYVFVFYVQSRSAVFYEVRRIYEKIMATVTFARST